jgi:hypothetical protein
LADWFLGRPNNKAGIDLPYLHSNNSNLAQGQMCNKLHRAAQAVRAAGVGAGAWARARAEASRSKLLVAAQERGR